MLFESCAAFAGVAIGYFTARAVDHHKRITNEAEEKRRKKGLIHANLMIGMINALYYIKAKYFGNDEPQTMRVAFSQFGYKGTTPKCWSCLSCFPSDAVSGCLEFRINLGRVQIKKLMREITRIDDQSSWWMDTSSSGSLIERGNDILAEQFQWLDDKSRIWQCRLVGDHHDPHFEQIGFDRALNCFLDDTHNDCCVFSNRVSDHGAQCDKQFASIVVKPSESTSIGEPVTLRSIAVQCVSPEKLAAQPVPAREAKDTVHTLPVVEALLDTTSTGRHQLLKRRSTCN